MPYKFLSTDFDTFFFKRSLAPSYATVSVGGTTITGGYKTNSGFQNSGSDLVDDYLQIPTAFPAQPSAYELLSTEVPGGDLSAFIAAYNDSTSSSLWPRLSRKPPGDVWGLAVNLPSLDNGNGAATGYPRMTYAKDGNFYSVYGAYVPGDDTPFMMAIFDVAWGHWSAAAAIKSPGGFREYFPKGSGFSLGSSMVTVASADDGAGTGFYRDLFYDVSDNYRTTYWP